MGVLGAVQGWPFARQDDVRTRQNYFVRYLTMHATALQTVRLAFGHCWQGGAVLDGGSSRTCGPQRSQLADLSFLWCRRSDFAAEVF